MLSSVFLRRMFFVAFFAMTSLHLSASDVFFNVKNYTCFYGAGEDQCCFNSEFLIERKEKWYPKIKIRPNLEDPELFDNFFNLILPLSGKFFLSLKNYNFDEYSISSHEDGPKVVRKILMSLLEHSPSMVEIINCRFFCAFQCKKSLLPELLDSEFRSENTFFLSLAKNNLGKFYEEDRRGHYKEEFKDDFKLKKYFSFFKIFRLFPNLEIVDLSENQLGNLCDKGLKILFKELASLKKLKILNILDNNILSLDKECFRVFLEGLASLEHLEVLNISGNTVCNKELLSKKKCFLYTCNHEKSDKAYENLVLLANHCINETGKLRIHICEDWFKKEKENFLSDLGVFSWIKSKQESNLCDLFSIILESMAVKSLKKNESLLRKRKRNYSEKPKKKQKR